MTTFLDAHPFLALALVFGGFAMVAIPIALRIAGLTGEQIVSVLTMTMQFVSNLVSAFRQKNKDESTRE